MLGVYIGAVVLIAFVAYVFRKCGALPTLSEAHYLLPKWMFPTAMIASATLPMPHWLDVSGNLAPLAFISAVAICFVGAAPLFKSRDRKLHLTCVFVAGISALIWALAIYWQIPVILSVFMLGLIYKFRQYWGLIMELSMFACIYVMLLII